MTGKIILIVILILVVLFVVVGIAGFIVLFLAYGEDPDHENSVNVPRGTTMETTRTTNISRTGKK